MTLAMFARMLSVAQESETADYLPEPDLQLSESMEGPDQVLERGPRLRIVLPANDRTSNSPDDRDSGASTGAGAVPESDGQSALKAYLNQLRRYPLMTREEEHAVAVELARTGQAWLAQRLVTANLRLVVKLAREYRRAHHNLLDLIQEGNMGLVIAVQKFDPNRGVKLASYASWWIRAYVLKFILANWRLVKVATTQTQRKLFFNLEKERAKLERFGAPIDPRQLGAVLDASEQQIVEMERRLIPERSLDAPIRGGDKTERTFGDLLRSAMEDCPDVRVESDEFLAILRAKLDTFQRTLSGRDLEIFQRRLLTDEPETSAEIARGFGISRERVRQLEERLRKKTREFLRQELGDSVDAA
jgi:RNA polymerase sigma-32 factor